MEAKASGNQLGDAIKRVQQQQSKKYEKTEMQRIIKKGKCQEKDFYGQSVLDISQKFKSVCLIGVTGHGKSTTANTLVGEPDFFQTSANCKSET